MTQHKSMLLAVALSAITASVTNAQNASIPDGVRSIESVYQQAYFVGTTPSRDGTLIFWEFRMPSFQSNHFVFVDVYPNATPAEFGACYVVALDAVRYYKAQQRGESLPRWQQPDEPAQNLTDILQTYTNITFLGAGAALNNSEIRWALYCPPNDGYPGVVVNVAPVETADSFITAYYTAVGAVMEYMRVGDVPPNSRNENVVKDGRRRRPLQKTLL